MDKQKKQYPYGDTRTSYVQGNTVRKLHTAPDIRREEQQYTPTPRRQTRTEQKTLSGVSFQSLLILSVAIIMTLAVCVNYLMLEYEVSKMDTTIKTMESTLKHQLIENDAAYVDITKAYDLDYVYRVAVEDLGMVYPKDNTVIFYESMDESYVRQYEDIPD